MKKILLISLIVIMGITGLSYIIPNGFGVGADGSKFVASNVLFLSSGITSTQTSITLTKLTVPNTTQPIQMTDFGDIGYITIEPGRSKREFISFTDITQNAGGTATLTGVTRGLSPIAPYTASTTQQVSHSGGVQVIVSNPPQLYNDATFKANDETITGDWLVPAPVNTTSIANKNYVDNVVNQGAATSTETNGGIVELATQLEMASSTDGGANKPLVLQAKYATSTPTVSTGLHVPIAQNNGKLHQLWLDLTEHFIFSSIFATNASSTSATTTDFAITGTRSHWNGIDFNFDGTALPTTFSSTMTSDVSGNVSFNSPTKLLADGTSYGSTLNSTTTAFTLTLPANTLSSTDGLRIKALTRSISNGVKAWDIQWGDGTSSTTLISYAQNSGVVNTISEMNIEVFNNNSGTQKYGYGNVISGASIITASSTDMTLDTTSQTYISFRTNNVDNDSDSVEYVGITVEKLID